MKMELEKKVKYPQPHNIKFNHWNEAYREHMKYYIHHKLKYDAKYKKSKQSRRLYD